MKKLIKEFSKEIDIIFPSIELLVNPESKQISIYNFFSISTYNHWLSESEYAKNIVFHGDVDNNRAQNDETSLDNIVFMKRKLNYHKMESNYLAFFLDLSKSFKIYYYGNPNIEENLADNEPTTITHSVNDYYEFESLDEYIFFCLCSIREIQFINICIPELNLIILGNYDLCNIVCYKNTLGKEILSDYIKKHNLYLLENQK